MDRLKFRFLKDDGTYFYQEDQYLSSFLGRIYKMYNETHPAHLPFEIEDRLEQCTEFKDGDTDIYYGDIVECCLISVINSKSTLTTKITVKELDDLICMSEADTLTIIGNIHSEDKKNG